MVQKNDLLKLVYGATLRGVIFYQVLKVDKSRVYLVQPEVKNKGIQNGITWVSKLSKEETPTHYAKFIRGKLKICEDSSFKVSKGYWNTLTPTKLNEKEQYYTD